MVRGGLTACAMLMLAACGDGAANETAGNNAADSARGNAAAGKGKSEAQNRVREMGDGQRNAVLIRAIREANFDCQHVERSDVVATTNNLPAYLATCQDGTVYAVAIQDDGTAVVREAMREPGR